MAKTKISGYWTFFCNPKYWAVEEFLKGAKPETISEYRITSWQKSHFKNGQYGIIRVGNDGRTKAQLNGRPKLKRGIYAIVQVIGPPYPQSNSQSQFKISMNKDESGRLIVPIKYVRNYLQNPVLFSDIEGDSDIKRDPYLLKGIQAASMPLQEEAFNRILLFGEDLSSS